MIYRTKLNELGLVDKYKERLVARGCDQRYGIDYTEIFASVRRLDTVRMIIVIAAHRGWVLYQLDVKYAFLYGRLNEDVYVEQPKGYEKKGYEHMVYKLHKALYALKQAPRASFSRIESYFIKEDDLIYTDNDDDGLTKEFRMSMKKEFDMTDL
ncbi:hypothetical protein A2U01_0019735, partial [Trifolium medium]|nr:hypothetical protein [Trifolium medium]